MIVAYNLRTRHLDPVLAVGHLALIVLRLVEIATCVSKAAENTCQVSIAELGTSQRAAPIIQRLDDPTTSTSEICPLEDFPDDSSFLGHKLQLHTALFAVSACDVCAITERYRPAVEEALPCVFSAAFARIYAVIDGSLLVHQRCDCLGDHLTSAATEVFGDANNFDTRSFQLFGCIYEKKGIAEYSTLPIKKYYIYRTIIGRSISHHAVELRSCGKFSAEAAIDIFPYDLDIISSSIFVPCITLGLDR